MHTKKAFSFVEVIIVIAIIALLAIIGFNMQGASQQKALNTKTIGDIGTLNNSFQSYLEAEKTLPNPKGNTNYFGTGSEYIHINAGDEDDTSKSFGKHGFVTENILPKAYLNYLPLDPRTSQYYAYGKTTNNAFFEVAGVLKIDGRNTATVLGNYPGETGPYNLIKEYNGPDFVNDKSTSSFPYNPDERLLTAKIDNFSGNINISNTSLGYSISDQNQILEHTLVTGDTITATAGSQATLYYSDGSQSTLGEAGNSSELTLANMEFPTEDNLITRIQLALTSGTLWTKATSLHTDSEFEIYTNTTSASVRGTIFGIQTNGATSNITLEEGILELKQIPPSTDIIKSIQKSTIKSMLIPISSLYPDSTIIGPQSIDNHGQSLPSPIPNNLNDKINNNDQIEFESINIDTSVGNGIIQFIIEEKHKEADIVLLKTGGEIYQTPLSNTQISGNILTLEGGINFQKYVPIETIEKDESRVIEEINGTLTPGNISLITLLTGNNNFSFSLCKNQNGKIECIASKTFDTKNGVLEYNVDDIQNVSLNNTKYDDIISGVVKNTPQTVPGSCATPPGNTNILLTQGSPTNQNTLWQSNNTTAPCYYTCDNGYSGDSCTEAPILASCEAGTEYMGYILQAELSDTQAQTIFPTTDGALSSYAGDISIGENSLSTKEFTGNITCNDGSLSGTFASTERCTPGVSSEFIIDGITYCEPIADSGKELYAFAPYDRAGDIELYNAQGTPFSKLQDSITNNTTTLPANCTTKQSFCQESTGEKGIFINTPHFLKYFNMTLGSDFIIEMSIAKQALEQTGGRYIFDIQDSGKGLFINKSSGKNILKYNNTIICNDINFSPQPCNLSFNNTFESITIKSDNISIGSQNFSVPNINITDFYLGSKQNQTTQLNGVINYLKIYK